MNDKITEISVSDLKKMVRLILAELDQRDEEDRFRLEDDLYWNIPDKELYEAYKEPEDLTLGSLIDDWQFLETAIRGERQLIRYDLCKLASLLRYIGKTEIADRRK